MTDLQPALNITAPAAPALPRESNALCGTFVQCPDEKARVVLPSSFRYILGSRPMVIDYPGARLILAPPETWERLCEGEQREFWLANGRPCRVNNTNGRFQIQAEQWQHLTGGAHEPLALVGQGDVVMVMSAARWRERMRRWDERGERP
jgi:DNA-binding transcriptional regulator/RsmH inhibitor MraZ